MRHLHQIGRVDFVEVLVGFLSLWVESSGTSCSKERATKRPFGDFRLVHFGIRNLFRILLVHLLRND